MGDDGGDAGPSQAGSKKVKFTPSVPARRLRGQEDAAGGSSGTTDRNPSHHEAFAKLIRTAQAEASWQRGGGGTGGGGGGAGAAGGRASTGSRSSRAPKPEPAQAQVMFQAVQAPSPAATAAAKRSAGQAGAEKGSSSGGGSGGSKARDAAAATTDGPSAGKSASSSKTRGSKGSGAKAEPRAGRKTGPSAMDIDEWDEEAADEDDEEEEARSGLRLDYTQYYPTVLPMVSPEQQQQRAAGAAAPAAAAPSTSAAAAPAADGAQQPLEAGHAMGLLSGQEEEHVLLLQLPWALPGSSGHVKPEQADGDMGGGLDLTAASTSAAAGGSASTSSAPGDHAAATAGASIKDLPSGQIGRLLVFKSGKVKLQLGDILMDVSTGLPVTACQEVAAVSLRDASCTVLGRVSQRVVASPDIWQLLEDRPVPEYAREPWVPQPPVASAAAAADASVQRAGKQQAAGPAAAAAQDADAVQHMQQQLQEVRIKKEKGKAKDKDRG